MALRLAHMLYGVETNFHLLQRSDDFGEIVSSVGSKQGCPLGTLLCSCGSRRGLQEHIRKYPSVAIVDDVKRVIELPRLVEAHLHWKQTVRDRGGDLKETKCSVYAPGFSTDELLKAGVPVSMVVRGQDGLRNLGGVIGDHIFKRAYVVNKFDTASSLIDHAMCLEKLQERSRAIFGALSAQLFFLAGVVSLQEYPDHILRWTTSFEKHFKVCFLTSSSQRTAGVSLRCRPSSGAWESAVSPTTPTPTSSLRILTAQRP